MDIPKLKQTYNVLLDYMEQKKMSHKTINVTRNMCNHLFEHVGEYKSYHDYYEKFIDPKGYLHPGSTRKQARNTLRRIWAFDEYDHLPDGTNFTPIGMSHSCIAYLNPTYTKFLNNEVMKALDTGRSLPESIKNSQHLMASFLFFMQNNGAKTLKKINAEKIGKFFYNDSKPIRCNNYSFIIRMVLGRIDNNECQRIKELIPRMSKKLPDYRNIDEETMKKINEKLSGQDKTFSLRDRAIMMISVYTGLRASDIARLTLDNIDWDTNLITLIQHKTQQLLRLPLRAIVGNALYDYIKNEYVKNPYKWFFPNEFDITKHINSHRIGDVIEHFFDDIENLPKGNQKRVRLFRHHLVSQLLKNNNSIEIVRSILGHTSKNAINNYIDVNEENLRSCALDISEFPIKDDLFNF